MKTITHWTKSGLSVAIKNSQLAPVTKNKNICSINSEQGTIYRLIQKSTKKEWMLKKFNPETCPSRQYLTKVRKLVPENVAFLCSKKRMILTKDDLRDTPKTYFSKSLSQWLDNCVLMQKVPGNSWKETSCKIRDGKLKISGEKRAQIAQNLSQAIQLLEQEECSHRDLSHENVYIDGKTKHIYIIDWESLYHSSLKQKNNFTSGTLGYTPSWLSNKPENKQKKASWKKNADRFALGILISEIMLMRIDERPTKEGVLFSNEILQQQEHPYVAEKVQKMYEHSEHLGDLFLQCLTAKSFEECPTPEEWTEALGQITPAIAEVKTKKPFVLSSLQNVPKESWIKWGKPILLLLLLLLILFFLIPFFKSDENNKNTAYLAAIKDKEENVTKQKTKKLQNRNTNSEKVNHNLNENSFNNQHENNFTNSRNNNNSKRTSQNKKDQIRNIDAPVFSQNNEHENSSKNVSGKPVKKIKQEEEFFGLQEIDPKEITKKYQIKILYADNDLKMIVDGKKLNINHRNRTFVKLIKGTYPVKIYFSAIKFSKNGKKKVIGKTSFQKDITFSDKNITIRINRLKKIWKVVR